MYSTIFANSIKSTDGTINIDRNDDGSSEIVIDSNGATFSENIIASGNIFATSGFNIQGTRNASLQNISSSTTLSGNSFVMVDTSGGDVTVTLPSATSYSGRIYTIKMTSTSNKMQLSGGGTNIDDSASQDYSGNLASIQVISNGTQWYYLYESHPGADPEPWTPADTTTDAWFDASHSASLTLSSPDVTTWASRSGSLTLTQATAANKPHLNAASLNGLDTITFDGTDDYFECTGTGMGSLTTFSLFIVDKHRTGSSNDDQIIGTLGWNSTSLHINYRGNRRKWSNNSGGVEFGSSALNTWIMSSYVDSGTTVYCRQNGATTASTATSNTTMDLEPFSLGAWEQSASTWNRFVTMDFAEIIMVKSGVSDDIREKFEGYLAHKWGLTGSLPSDHPYKSSAPTK